MFLYKKKPNFKAQNAQCHLNPSLQTPIKTTTITTPMQPTNIHIYPISKRDMAMYFNTNILLLAFFAITGILFSGKNNNMVAGQTCQLGDLQVLITQCAVYVQKNVPNVEVRNFFLSLWTIIKLFNYEPFLHSLCPLYSKC